MSVFLTPYLRGPDLQRLVVVRELCGVALPHALHHQLGYRGNIQTCTGGGSVVGPQSNRRDLCLVFVVFASHRRPWRAAGNEDAAPAG